MWWHYLVFLVFSIQMNGDSFHIWFEQSGGFAGLTTSVEISSDTLEEAEYTELSQLIDQSDFFNYQIAENQTGIPDQFHYQLTIEKSGEKKTLTLSDANLSDDMRSLINYLKRKARRGN